MRSRTVKSHRPPDGAFRPRSVRVDYWQVNTYTVSEVDQFDEFQALEGEWNDILSRSPTDIPFLRHEWLCLWWKHFGSGRRLAVLLARKDSRLRAALPLMETKISTLVGPFVILQSLTNFHSYRFNLICEKGESNAAAALGSYLGRRPHAWHLVRLEEVPEDAPAVVPFLEAARAEGFSTEVWQGPESPYLTLHGGYRDYSETLGRAMRAGLHKKERKLRELGAVDFQYASRPSEVGEVLEKGLAIEGSGWKDRAGSSIISNPALTAFYREWAALAAARGWLRLSLLSVNGMAAAFDYSVLYEGHYYALKIGYDPRWSKFSVGQILKAEILRRCFESGIREYDFLGVMSQAKSDWRPLGRRHAWHFIYSRHWMAALHHFQKFRVKPAIRRWTRR